MAMLTFVPVNERLDLLEQLVETLRHASLKKSKESVFVTNHFFSHEKRLCKTGILVSRLLAS